MVKLEEYEISGYKNIKKANLTFENVNVIIGPNNSGKSNFIQSISFLNHLINSSTDELAKDFKRGLYGTYFGEIAPRNKWRENFDKRSKGSINFRLKIYNSVTNRHFFYGLKLIWSSKDFDLSYKIDEEFLEVKNRNKPGKAISIFSRKGKNVKYGSEFSKTSVIETVPNSFSVIRILKLILTPNDKKEYVDAIASLNYVVKAPIFYFSHTELLKSSSSERLNEFNGRMIAFDLENEIMALEEEKDQWDIFRTAVKNTLNISNVEVYRFATNREGIINIDDIKPKDDIIKLLSFSHLGDSKNLNQLSDGSILIIAIITKILSSTEDIIFIEEPENSTHPKALIDLFSFFKSFSTTKQFIITSHSIALLNKSKIKEIIISSVNKEGDSEFFNIDSRKDLKNRLKQGHINFSDELFFSDINEDEKFEF